ncbi:hypothetical protein HN51_015249 [Arachis hypogaea]|uniref:Ubiquitin thioesterase OTU n=1 Tax=Arachis hypogaea TaxID=3818 RepID=A0A445CLB0_ARAHY|nr:OTU domain-containing protein At3g57810 [Arachis hypogaea]QHO44709.1 OTU domain-containing protein [Arachis hypogaea]QHO44710.1 OTU domain-containing protein [Arachis hypogaea]QHO44711.1 OTU domain-containing protein [Arachis hypogaea]RYR51721.1 hypothetical protein Ahy_A06g026703 [Arachis hypogaea]
MSVCSSSMSLYSINAVMLKGHAHQILMSSSICGVRPQETGTSNSCSFNLSPEKSQINHAAAQSISTTTLSSSTVMGKHNHYVISLACQSMNMRLLVSKPKALLPKVKSTMGSMTWPSGFLLEFLICNSNSKPTNSDECNESTIKFSHGKKVYTDYYVIGIPGDGRCLFRSVAHGACLRSGKLASSETLERQLADELRGQVADEFIKRREETEWFVEGDFETYVSQIRKPHMWGGEPELFIASHVLQVPITVYMYDEDAGGLITIAEYGQEYGKENPITVLYHGYGHYDALEIPTTKGHRPRF